MALSSEFKKSQPVEDLEEVLEALEKLLDRTKIMYEQYFMGIQKVAPMQLHRDVERKIRELTQLQMRNTGLRYRFTTMCQKFGAYNTYWKRTLREIEQGRYVRELQRAKRKVEQNGKDLPEELLVKLPKLVQERIRRDRARMARIGEDEAERQASEAMARAAELPRAPRPGVHEISEEDTLFDDEDIDNLFGAIREQSVTSPPPIAPDPEPKPEPAPPKSARPRGPIVPASVTSRLKPVAPPQPPPLKATGPLVPPPFKAAAVPPPQVPRPPPPAASGLPPGMSEKQCRELHARYAKARQLVGDKSDVSYDKLLATLNKQAPAIMKEHGARGVDFQVVVRGDKVVLKAKPVK